MPEQDVIIDNKPTVITDPFDALEFKTEPIVAQEIKKDEPIIDKKNEPIIDKKEEPIIDKKIEPVVDGSNFLKEKLGYDNWDAAKTEIESLRTKAKLPEIKNESLDPVKIKEYYSIIDKKEKLEGLTSGEITKDNAPKIIKAAMTEKYKLSDDMVKHKFNKQFAMPKEPVQDKDNESDEDFAEKKEAWKSQVADIEMDILIEASVVRPELEKINSELKLPEVLKAEPSLKEYTPEELAKANEGLELFLKDAETALKSFAGFNVTYKDKDVEVQSAYNLSEEENAEVLKKARIYAENGADANAIFGQRWVKDGNFDFVQFSKDLAALDTEDKRSQKYVGDTVAKAKIQFIKGKHNIDLNTDTGKGELKLEEKTAQQKSEDAVWGIS